MKNHCVKADKVETEIKNKIEDQRARPWHDLRISVTDRCNFRCVYCMPKKIFNKDYQYLTPADSLSFAEITRLARIAVQLGVSKIRLTGGEPLLRPHLEKLVMMLSDLITIAGKPVELALTTNGVLLTKKAEALKIAGLQRITVSLDALDPILFKKISDVDCEVHDVLQGIEAATQAGLYPLKINVVIKKGLNDQEIIPIVRHFKNSPHTVRFIEYMDTGNTNQWQPDQVFSATQIVQEIDAIFPLKPLSTRLAGQTARFWAYQDGQGGIETIASITQPFCHDCTRARLSTDGKLYTCLFASTGHDFRSLLRTNPSGDAEIMHAMAKIWQQRIDRYSEVRFTETSGTRNKHRIEMSYIGG